MTPRPPQRGRDGRSPARPARPGRRPGVASRHRVRIFALLSAMAVAFAAIGIRLAYIQGVASTRYVAVGQSEWMSTVTLAAERGAILDRNGDELAMSIPQTTIYANPHQVTDPRVEAAALSPVLHVAAATLQTQLSGSSEFVYLARTVGNAAAAAVAKLDLAGIFSLQEPKRFDPAGQLASPLLGTVGIDGEGLSGLESRYNAQLEGRPGKMIEELDPQGHQIPGGLKQYQAPLRGQDLVLTIDEPLQYDAEQALAQAIMAAKAKGGIALLMDSQTGDILAAADLTMPTTLDPQTLSKPPAVPVSIPAPPGATTTTTSTTTPAPTTPGATTPGSTATSAPAPPAGPPQPVEAATASAFTQVYEPGSVNKLVTISAALAAGVVKPADQFSIPTSLKVAGTTFHDAEPHPVEDWTVTDILANSSNIGTIKIGQKLGENDLLSYVHAFGEGQVTDVGFPWESAGLVPTKAHWSGTTTPTVAIGQGISVTAIQILDAYNTIANGGVYIAPRLVRGTIDSQGVEHVVASAPPHRVVSASVAAQMTTMLNEVVRVGTGTVAAIPPYTVAGKTGTALVPAATGGYRAADYVASFAGFAPSEKPAITAMVMLDGTPDFGGAASAPVFATIARDGLQSLEVPAQAPEPPAVGVPLATSQSANAAEPGGTPLPTLGSNPTGSASTPPASTPPASTPPTRTPPTGTPPASGPAPTTVPLVTVPATGPTTTRTTPAART